MSSRFIAAEYKAPNEKVTPLGYTSSILHGDTAEGGLKSLTYKSVYASQLIEELELAKQAIVPSNFQLSRIMETDMLTESKLEQLRADIASIKNANIGRNTDNDTEIKTMGVQLEQELQENKGISPDYRQRIQKQSSNFSLNQGHTVCKMNLKLDVQRMEDVKDFDSSIYQGAKERRAEEERGRAAQAEAEAQNSAMAAEDFELGAQQTPPEGIFTDMQNINGLEQRDFDSARIEGDDRQFTDPDQVLMHDSFGGMGSIDSPNNINQQMNQQMQQQMGMEQSMGQGMAHGQLHQASQHGSPEMGRMQPYSMDSMSFPINNQGMSGNHNQEAANIEFPEGYPMPHNLDQFNGMNSLTGDGLDHAYMQNQSPF